jgi:hypothetical protein
MMAITTSNSMSVKAVVDRGPPQRWQPGGRSGQQLQRMAQFLSRSGWITRGKCDRGNVRGQTSRLCAQSVAILSAIMDPELPELAYAT